MYSQPLDYARTSSLLLDAAALTLDANTLIRNSSHALTRGFAIKHAANVTEMCHRAVDEIPEECPEEVADTIKLEAQSLLTLSNVASMGRHIRKSSNEKVLGRSGWPAFARGDLNLEHGGHVKGLLAEGPSILGVSCIFTVQNSGTAGTRGFWVDNMTGLPVGDWLRHRAQHCNYINEFIDGPWREKMLTDAQMTSVSIEYSSVFCDYAAQRFGVGDTNHTMRFRFRWRGQQVHSFDLTTERDRIAQLQSRIEKNIM